MMKNKGITLVALVVTIIIMLILAGVTIGLVTGENGLFKMAQQSVEKYQTAQSEEESTMQELADELHGIIGKGKDDKTPGEMSGEGTEDKPFLIESIEDLIEFSNKVNGGTTYENQIVKLAVNLDFQSEDSYVDYKTTSFGDINGENGAEELKTELTTGNGFTSIGNDQQQFKGTFDGQNRTISNLYINIAEDYKGLFGYVGSKGSIKNLTISKAEINCEAGYIGTLAGSIDGGTIENIKTINGKVIGNRLVGGIVGYCNNNTTINNCINENNILVNGGQADSSGWTHLDAGGIAGNIDNNSYIFNSYNNGKIKSNKNIDKFILIGGISGSCANESIIDSCYNTGYIGDLIEGSRVRECGGIVGDVKYDSKISKCYNIGTISGLQYVGGIVGIQGYKSMTCVENCYNTGDIMAISGLAGGISGVSDSTTGSEISNCYNVGNISVTQPINSSIRKHCRNRQ